MFFYKNRYLYKSCRKTKLKLFFIIFLLLFIVCLFYLLIQFKKEVLPSAIVISEKYVSTKVNNEINNAVTKVIEELNLTSADFFENSFNNKQQMNFLNVNALVINNVCSRVAVLISENLNNININKIQLPIGMFSGIEMFSSCGPKFNVSILPVGDALVDYETSFQSVGINQINFQIWLNIETEVKLVNPFYEKNLNLKRKLMLVNTIFNGDVPSAYLDFMNKSDIEK